jgi:hypothetical protein
MDSSAGFLHKDVSCPSCKKLHDLFIELEEQTPTTYRFTCPHTGHVATWLCDKAAHLSQERPDSAIHAVPHSG